MASTTSVSTTVAPIRETKVKPKLSALQTPLSASYPSELRSPLPGTPMWIKKEDNVKTPITPPVAYLDFLKTMSPALMSPAPTGTRSHFNFAGRVPERPYPDGDYKVPDVPSAQPTLSRTSSMDSTATVMTLSSVDSDSSGASFESTSSSNTKRARSPEPESVRPRKSVKALDLSRSESASSGTKLRPQSPRIVIPPPTPFVKPTSARLPRRSQFPGTPLSPANLRSPMSARSHHEPRSASCLSATPWSASFSPTEEGSGSNTSKVCVRQVVTRTVTYSQKPLDPAPKGKRRKLED